MLAGIGVTIAAQQLHVVLGGHAQSSLLANLAGLPEQLLAHHAGSVLVGILTVMSSARQRQAAVSPEPREITG